MTSMATTDLGLEQTIARAHSALEARERHLRGIAERKARGTRRNWLKVIVMGMLVFALYEVFDHMSPHAVTVSHSHVEDDLEKVLGQVRHDVEEYFEKNQAYPEALPDTALTGIVQYRKTDNGFIAFASMSGTTLTLDESGRISRDESGRYARR
jgi:hypothetical protein